MPGLNLDLSLERRLVLARDHAAWFYERLCEEAEHTPLAEQGAFAQSLWINRTARTIRVLHESWTLAEFADWCSSVFGQISMHEISDAKEYKMWKREALAIRNHLIAAIPGVETERMREWRC